MGALSRGPGLLGLGHAFNQILAAAGKKNRGKAYPQT